MMDFLNWRNRARAWFSRRDLYVDLGTENTLIYLQGKGLVLNEPSFVSYRISDHGREAIAFGSEAKRMYGRTPDNIEIVRPLKDGVIADFDATLLMLREFLDQAFKYSDSIFYGRLVISLPCRVNAYEQRAVKDVGRALRIKQTILVDEPVLAAIGADMPITAPTGSMIVDIGGGTTEIAVISMGGLAHAHTLRVGGHEMDQRIIEHFRTQFNFSIGELTAEYLKVHYANVNLDIQEFMAVKGMDLSSGLPKTIDVPQMEIGKAIEPSIRSIIDAIQNVLAVVPPELSSDLGTCGIIIAGGVGQISGLCERVGRETGIDVSLASDPLRSTGRGGAQLLDSPKLLNLLLANR
jgi:rod shape-determining protein MreB